MKIVNKDELKASDSIRVCDIVSGECFHFLNHDKLYMKAERNYYISIDTGEIFIDAYEIDCSVKPVKTELKILR